MENDLKAGDMVEDRFGVVYTIIMPLGDTVLAIPTKPLPTYVSVKLLTKVGRDVLES